MHLTTAAGSGPGIKWCNLQDRPCTLMPPAEGQSFQQHTACRSLPQQQTCRTCSTGIWSGLVCRKSQPAAPRRPQSAGPLWDCAADTVVGLAVAACAGTSGDAGVFTALGGRILLPQKPSPLHALGLMPPEELRGSGMSLVTVAQATESGNTASQSLFLLLIFLPLMHRYSTRYRWCQGSDCTMRCAAGRCCCCCCCCCCC